MIHDEINNAAACGLGWLKNQEPVAIKGISRSLQALSMWNEPVSGLIELLLSGKKDGFWETDAPLLDTARSCSALAGCGLMPQDSLNWILNQQKDGGWNDSEIETAYALIALGDCGMKNKEGCEWLLRNYGEKWEHVGTTSLIITALLRQDGYYHRLFINERARWILSKRKSGGWTHIATSNLAIQAMILAAKRDIGIEIGPSIKWLLKKQVKDNWGNINQTALSLISLRMYLDKLNNNSVN